MDKPKTTPAAKAAKKQAPEKTGPPTDKELIAAKVAAGLTPNQAAEAVAKQKAHDKALKEAKS